MYLCSPHSRHSSVKAGVHQPSLTSKAPLCTGAMQSFAGARLLDIAISCHLGVVSRTTGNVGYFLCLLCCWSFAFIHRDCIWKTATSASSIDLWSPILSLYFSLMAETIFLLLCFLLRGHRIFLRRCIATLWASASLVSSLHSSNAFNKNAIKYNQYFSN